MSRTAIVVAIGLLLVAGGAAYYAGIGPAPGGSDASDRRTDYSTGTPLGTSAGSGDSTATTETVPPFSFTIEAVEECGLSCRDVTATLRNNQAEPATDVTVLTRIYAGRDNTAEADRVWEGSETIGDLDAGRSHTTTRRVELSLQDGLKVENHDGWVTVVTTVRSSERTVTFRDSEQVA